MDKFLEMQSDMEFQENCLTVIISKPYLIEDAVRLLEYSITGG
jgi:hypothetical protein